MANIKIITPQTADTFKIGPIDVAVFESGSTTDNRIGTVMITVAPRTVQTPLHYHRMHDETFLVISGTMRFTVGSEYHDVSTGGYVVVPVEARHTFSNPFDEPLVFFNTFTPAYYVEYLRELSQLVVSDGLSPETILKVMARYATEPA